ncbi:hypothetical protein [Haladaptatus sp. DFWS20]|uniref:hypothetical protein n=1 Tax=Haladaptatus sp. DFWS20 TaxID=3403467 RepID=UPI003EB8F0CA
MGLFKNLGRKVEEFKKTSEAVAEEGASYECGSCGERFYVEKSECSECGGTVASVVKESKSSDTEERRTK